MSKGRVMSPALRQQCIHTKILFKKIFVKVSQCFLIKYFIKTYICMYGKVLHYENFIFSSSQFLNIFIYTNKHPLWNKPIQKTVLFVGRKKNLDAFVDHTNGSKHDEMIMTIISRKTIISVKLSQKHFRNCRLNG